MIAFFAACCFLLPQCRNFSAALLLLLLGSFHFVGLLHAAADFYDLPRGVWVSHVNSSVYESREEMRRALDHVEDIGANAVFPVIWNKQSFFFSSGTLDEVLGEGFTVTTEEGEDVLATMSSMARQRDLEVYASFESGLKIAMRGKGQEKLTRLGSLIVQRENWLIEGGDGERIEHCHFDVCFSYLNLLNAEVESFLWNMVRDVLRDYDLDGIIFDDHFSMPAWPPQCDASVLQQYSSFSSQPAFTAERLGTLLTGRSKTHLCAEVTAMLREEAIISFIRKVRSYAQILGKKVILSPAGLPSWSKREWHQDWKRMVLESVVDGVIMQAFRGLSYRNLVYSHELKQLRVGSPHIPLGVVILLGLKEAHHYAHGERIFRQTRTALEAGRTPSFFYHETVNMPAQGYSEESRRHWIIKTKELLLSAH